MSELIPGDSTYSGVTPFNSASAWRGEGAQHGVDPEFEHLVQEEMRLLQTSVNPIVNPMAPGNPDPVYPSNPNVSPYGNPYGNNPPYGPYDDSQYFRVLEEDSPRVRRAKERLRSRHFSRIPQDSSRDYPHDNPRDNSRNNAWGHAWDAESRYNYGPGVGYGYELGRGYGYGAGSYMAEGYEDYEEDYDELAFSEGSGFARIAYLWIGAAIAALLLEIILFSSIAHISGGSIRTLITHIPQSVTTAVVASVVVNEALQLKRASGERSYRAWNRLLLMGGACLVMMAASIPFTLYPAGDDGLLLLAVIRNALPSLVGVVATVLGLCSPYRGWLVHQAIQIYAEDDQDDYSYAAHERRWFRVSAVIMSIGMWGAAWGVSMLSFLLSILTPGTETAAKGSGHTEVLLSLLVIIIVSTGVIYAAKSIWRSLLIAGGDRGYPMPWYSLRIAAFLGLVGMLLVLGTSMTTQSTYPATVAILAALVFAFVTSLPQSLDILFSDSTAKSRMRQGAILWGVAIMLWIIGVSRIAVRFYEESDSIGSSTPAVLSTVMLLLIFICCTLLLCRVGAGIWAADNDERFMGGVIVFVVSLVLLAVVVLKVGYHLAGTDFSSDTGMDKAVLFGVGAAVPLFVLGIVRSYSPMQG